MKRTTILFTCLMLVMAVAVIAQEAPESARPAGGKGGDSPTGADDCDPGIIHDDGGFENGYSGNAATVTDFGAADLFTELLPGEAYTKVCVCLTSNAGIANANITFMVWDDDGPGGVPGTVLATEAVAVAGVPGFPGGAWYSVDMAVPPVSDGSEFVGVRYAPLAGNNLFVCADESAGTPLNGGMIEFLPPQPWGPTGASFPGYRSMLIRAQIEEGGVPTLPVAGLVALAAILFGLSLVIMRRRREV